MRTDDLSSEELWQRLDALEGAYRPKRLAPGNSRQRAALAAELREHLLPVLSHLVSEVSHATTSDSDLSYWRATLVASLQHRWELWTDFADQLESAPDAALASKWRDSDRALTELRAATMQGREESQSMHDFSQGLHRSQPVAWGTPLLIGLNVLAFVGLFLVGANPLAPDVAEYIRWGANYGPATMDGQWWRLFSCMFMHFGLIHLGLNLYVFSQVGGLVERLIGSVSFVCMYCVCGVAGSLTSLFWSPTTPSAGASGAVFGVIGCLLGVLLLRRDSIPATARTSLMRSLLVFFVINLVLGVVVPGIDLAAHLGGAVAGFAIGIGLSQPVSRSSASRRASRNALVLSAVIACLVIAAQQLPAAPPDVIAHWELANRLARSAAEREERAWEQWQQGKLSYARFAEQVRHDILPRAKQLMEELEILNASDSPLDDEVCHAWLAEAKRSYESWQVMARFLQSRDPAQLRQALEMREEALEMRRQFAKRYAH